MEINGKLFTKGFNNGYLLAKHEPELANLLAKIENKENEYLKGFAFGKEEFDKEKGHDLQKDSVRDNVSEKDKDDIEREK